MPDPSPLTSQDPPHEELITTAEQLTPAWLTAALRRDGALPQGEVVALDVRAEQAFASNLFYLRPIYSAVSPATAPRCLFVKSTKPERPDTDGREVQAYQWLAPAREHLPMILHCYGAVHSPILQRSHIMLDDVSETHGVSDWPLPSAEQRAGIAEATASFHAYWWEHTDLGARIPFTRFPLSYHDSTADQQAFLRFGASLRAAYPRLIIAAGNLLPFHVQRMLEQVLDGFPNLWDRYLAQRVMACRNLTLVQGDAHWWQFLCPRDAQHDQVFMADLQFLSIGIPAVDLANRMIGRWDRQQRQTYEGEVITAYLAALRARGVTSYSPEQFMTDYRLITVFSFIEPLLLYTPEHLDEVEKQGTTNDSPGWIEYFQKTREAYDDLHCADLFVS